MKRLLAVALCACNGAPPPAPAPAPPPPRDAAAAGAPEPVFVPPPFELPPPSDPIAALESDTNFSCVVRASGHVDCWDLDGAMARVPDIDDAVAVAADEYTRCIARRAEITCFDLDHDKAVRPHRVALAAVVALVPGISWCALVGGGRLACWSTKTGKPSLVREVHDATSLVGNGSTTCATVRDGHVWCVDLTGDRPTPWRRIAGLDGVSVLAIRSGGDMPDDACAVRKLGVVTCFVIDMRGAAARPMVYETPDVDALAAMRGATALAMDPGLGDIVALVGGHVVRVDGAWRAETLPVLADANAISDGCARRAQGSVVCWGDRATGQPRLWHADLPVPVVGLAGVVSIATTADRSAAVTRDGHAFQWGWTGNRAVAVPVAGSHDLVSVVIENRGNAHPCFLHRDGGVTCISQDGPVGMDLEHAVSLRAEGYYVALLADGTARAWGEPIERTTKTIRGIAGAVELVGTGDFSCARDAAGRVTCGALPAPAIPVAIGAATALAMIHDTAWHGLACAIADGAVSCWHEGQEAAPTAIPLAARAVEMHGANESMCAKLADGSLACWGYAAPQPHVVLPPGTLDGPFTGGEDGCTIHEDGRAACWGGNMEGRLGDGSLLELDSPAAVPGLQ